MMGRAPSGGRSCSVGAAEAPRGGRLGDGRARRGEALGQPAARPSSRAAARRRRNEQRGLAGATSYGVVSNTLIPPQLPSPPSANANGVRGIALSWAEARARAWSRCSRSRRRWSASTGRRRHRGRKQERGNPEESGALPAGGGRDRPRGARSGSSSRRRLPPLLPPPLLPRRRQQQQW